tara:strand:+ start:1355 stop:2635 length:1281 start_codon:yes stop_codon:yes gene_type:complete
MTKNDAYRGTGGGSRRVPTYGGDQGRGGQGNVRRFTAPQRGGSFSDAATGRRHGSPRATDFRTSGAFGRAVRDTAANLGQGIANTGRKIGRGFVHPFQRLAGSIANNQAYHRYLDEIYGEDKSAALWDQAIRNRYDAPFDPDTENAAIQQFGQTGTGTSLGQAGKYFKQAGLTQNDIDKFTGVIPSKWAGNEAWLRSQAGGEGAEAFKTGMSFIKNAKATANLARATEAARNQLAEEGLPFRSGIEQEGGPSRSYPVDDVTDVDLTESWTRHDPGADDVFTEDITADIGGSPYNVTTGYDRDKIYDFERQRPKTTFRNRFTGQKHDPYDLVGTPTFPFSEENMAGDYTAGYPGMEVMNELAPYEDAMWRGPGGGAADMDRLYMNRIGDVINQGRYSAAPNISVSFDEEETPFERYNPRAINPSWNR